MKKISILPVFVLLVACATPPAQKTDTTQQVNDNIPPATTDAKTAPAIAQASETQKLSDKIQSLTSKSVYFDFDKFFVKPEYREILNIQADFIKNHANDVVTLEGNSDERGSSEYNLALGSKRANAVKNSLKILGVPARQIQEISLGNERPRLTCHEEKCWQENRRVDFIHKLD